MTRNRQPSESGLTLVEVLTVVIILVALTAIAVPIYVNQRQQAEATAVSANLGAIANVVATAMTNRQGDLAADSGYIEGGPGEIFDGGFGGKVPIKEGYSLQWNSVEKIWCVQGQEGDSGYYHYDEVAGPSEGPCP